MRIFGVFALALSFASVANASDVDWKLYGGASVSGPSLCFFDAAGVSRDKFIRVWVKCLARKDLESVKLDDDVAKHIAENIVAGYVPPIIVIGQMQFKQLPDVAMYEAIADLGAIQPQAQMYDELDCSGRMLRRLSTFVQANGQSGFQNRPSEWDYVAPEGNAANLLKILCPVP